MAGGSGSDRGPGAAASVDNIAAKIVVRDIGNSPHRIKGKSALHGEQMSFQPHSKTAGKSIRGTPVALGWFTPSARALVCPWDHCVATCAFRCSPFRLVFSS